MLDESYQEEVDLENWESWQPDPVDADPGTLSAVHISLQTEIAFFCMK